MLTRILCVALVLSSTSVTGDVWAQPLEDAKPEVANLAARCDAAILRHRLGQFWGAAGVAKEGEIVFAKGYGIADDSLRPISADTLFDIGSIAKQFTAAGVLRLEMAGKLSVDDPVSRFFPETGDRGGEVKLRHLLTHTSGMSDRTASKPLAFPDRDVAVKDMLAAKPGGKVGEKFEYCNMGYVVLAACMEKASGKTFEECMREQVFGPAGLKSTGFLDGVGVDLSRGVARVVEGRGGASKRGFLQDGWGWGFKGCGGVISSIADMVKWDRVLAGESLLTAAAKEKLFAVEKDEYAFGWRVERSVGGRLKINHSGGTRGFRAQYSRFPEEGYAFVVFTNEGNDPFAVEKLLMKEVWPDESGAAASRLLLGGWKLGEYKQVEFEEGVVWVVEHKGNAITLLLQHAPDGPEAVGLKTMAEITLPAGQALAIAGKIDASLQLKEGRNNEGETAAGKTSGGVFTMPYTPEADGTIKLPEGVMCEVMPNYSGMGKGGKPHIDPRTTLIIKDDDNGFWPVLVKMDDATAAKLAKELRTSRVTPER